MAQEPQQPFRYRSILEVGIISLVIYYLVGAPGLPTNGAPSTLASPLQDQDIPQAKAKSESLVSPDPGLQCSSHDYQGIHIFSTSPLVIYIDGFLSPSEADHLVSLSSSKWRPSTIFNNGVEESDDSVRKSEKALVDRDEIVQCIEARALAFQGWPESTYIERLWTQRYNTTGHYAHHYDWATAGKTSRRVSTFMVYLSGGEEVEGGGTNFPRIDNPRGKWCDFVECHDAAKGTVETNGVTFKVRKGAAVFWTNFDAEGRGYKETIHAGMPVRSGTKIGLNVWSWYQI